MARGRLTNIEKFAIQGMLSDNRSLEEIATSLGRTEGTVNKYITGELDNLHATVAKIAIEQDAKGEIEAKVQEQAAEIKRLKANQKKAVTKDAMIQEAYRRINEVQGLAAGTNVELVKMALEKNGTPPDAETLFGWAMQQLNAKHLMGRETAAKRERTVAIMTKAASEKGDEAREQVPATISRTARNNLYSISEQKIIE